MVLAQNEHSEERESHQGGRRYGNNVKGGKKGAALCVGSPSVRRKNIENLLLCISARLKCYVSFSAKCAEIRCEL